jgi:hypothetical protein
MRSTNRKPLQNKASVCTLVITREVPSDRGKLLESYLSIICLARAEESFHRIVTWDEEAGKVHEELASNVEEDQEHIDGSESKKDVDLRDVRLLLEVVESRVLGQLQPEQKGLAITLDG